MTIKRFYALIAVIFLTITIAEGQQQPVAGQPDMTIDGATRDATIDTLLKQLNESYVFPDTAKKMEADLRSRLKNNEYDTVTSGRAFAEIVSVPAMGSPST